MYNFCEERLRRDSRAKEKRMVTSEFVYEPTAKIAARALFQSDAYLIRLEPDNLFKWKSGILAPVYTDCRKAQGSPGPYRTLTKALSSCIEATFPSCTAIAGKAEAGLIWSAPVSQALGVAHAFVRKTPKDYGTGKMIEGDLAEGAEVVLVDDLLGSGGTAIEAVREIEDETGAHVIGVQSIVNWGFPAMRKGFESLGVPYCALVSYPEILDVAVELNLLTLEGRIELTAFYNNPKDHVWNWSAFVNSEQVFGSEAI
jgi:orotate phosphoribosyltransferase